MQDELYVNASGFKCVRTQLAKTQGRDPQEYEKTLRYLGHDHPELDAAIGDLDIVSRPDEKYAPEHRAQDVSPKKVTK